MATFTENRGIARTFIPGLMAEGLSATRALKVLSDLGRGVRKTEFLADWREIGGFEKKKDTFKYIRKTYKPTSATISETSESLSKEYSYVYKVKGRDSITGADKELDWRYATDDLLSIEEAEKVIAESIEEPVYETDIEDYKISAVGCLKSIVL